MKAVIYTAPNTVEVVDKPIPQPEDGEVVVKITASGLCGSDLHTYRGDTAGLSKLGFTMGHEFVGHVHSTKSDSFKVGDRVVSPFTISCGHCFFCEKGLTGRCEKSRLFGGDKLEGAQAEFVLVPMADTTLFHAPEALPDSHLIMMADIFPTGCSVVKNAWNLLLEPERKNAVCCVIGCGPVGLCAIMAAKEKFAKVYAIDPVAERRAVAEKYGAIPLDPNSDPAAVLHAATSNRGPDAVLEVVGNNAALNLAISLVRVSGVISSCGVHNHEITIPGNVAYGKGFRMQFGRCHARAMFAESLEILKKVSKETPELIDGFVQKKVKLEDAPEYYRLFNQQKVGKVIFDLSS